MLTTSTCTKENVTQFVPLEPLVIDQVEIGFALLAILLAKLA